MSKNLLAVIIMLAVLAASCFKNETDRILDQTDLELKQLKKQLEENQKKLDEINKELRR
jgi:peptidoglycan hydrolase CwlO-like protein